MGFTLRPALALSWSSRKLSADGEALRVTGIELHYIRLLAGIGLLLSIIAPANNPTGQWGQTHHCAGFFHPSSLGNAFYFSLFWPSPLILFLLLRSFCLFLSSFYGSGSGILTVAQPPSPSNPRAQAARHARSAVPESRPGRDYNPLSCSATVVAH